MNYKKPLFTLMLAGVVAANAFGSTGVDANIASAGQPATLIVVGTAVAVGFLVRLRRKGLPFRTPKKG